MPYLAKQAAIHYNETKQAPDGALLYYDRIYSARRSDMIGIIGAMEEEVAALKEAMEIEETVTRASM